MYSDTIFFTAYKITSYSSSGAKIAHTFNKCFIIALPFLKCPDQNTYKIEDIVSIREENCYAPTRKRTFFVHFTLYLRWAPDIKKGRRIWIVVQNCTHVFVFYPFYSHNI